MKNLKRTRIILLLFVFCSTYVVNGKTKEEKVSQVVQKLDENVSLSEKQKSEVETLTLQFMFQLDSINTLPNDFFEKQTIKKDATTKHQAVIYGLGL